MVIARLVRNVLVTLALYAGWFTAFAKFDEFADERSLEWLRLPGQFTVLLMFGAIAFWLYEGHRRVHWVLALSIMTGSTVMLVIGGLPNLGAWSFFAACFAFGAGGLVAGSVLISKLTRYLAKRSTAQAG